VRLSDFPVPDSPAARAALQVATEYLSEALINHSIRSWYWAVGFAAFEERSGFDAELLYTAALLHDIGLAEEFDNHTLAYELAGGHVAWALTAGAGWEKSRPDALPETFRREIIEAYPRLDLGAEFGRCVSDQAARKPGTAAARLVANGLVEKLERNPLETFARRNVQL
jgi:hypothetical protein